MNTEKLIPHLFRTESRKISAVLNKYFGIDHMEIAEDLVSDTFFLLPTCGYVNSHWKDRSVGITEQAITNYVHSL